MPNSNVLVDMAGPVARVTLNRPAERNAVTSDMLESLVEAAIGISADTAVRSVVVAASGDDFSVGADINDVADAIEAPPQSLLVARRDAERGTHLMRALREIPQPTICLLQGVATGAGACIAAACDFRIATSTTRIGLGEVRMGMNLMWGAIPVLVELIGASRTKQLAMSGDLIDSARAAHWGLIDEVCDAETLDERGQAWADKYAALPPVAVQMIKRSINRYALALGEAVSHMDADQWLLMTQSNDFKEAVSAFQQKRKPTFKGD
ncbi:MAG: enoyl-CoA hydratase/isomerase family protein [Pseudomonadota bacterium]